MIDFDSFSLFLLNCTPTEKEDSTLDEEQPYCDELGSGFHSGSCFDRKDYSEDTGLYPCKKMVHILKTGGIVIEIFDDVPPEERDWLDEDEEDD